MSTAARDFQNLPPISQSSTGGVPQRIVSIDALRGFVMFTMIFVNDLAGGGEKVPDWMVHFSDRHKGGSGMTFVDLVFPAFLFIVGMSIPIALSGRLAKGEPVWKLLLHVVARTVSLLAIGILMVNGEGGHANSKLMGFSGTTWTVLMFCSALLAFCSVSPPSWVIAGSSTKRIYRGLSLFLRTVGICGMIWAAFVFRGGKDGKQIISLDPFYIHPSWYGILGLIGWSYLVAAISFLAFRTNRTALLGCVILLLCLFAADRKGQFEGFWLSHIVGIGESLGSLASISAAGVLLGTIFLTPETSTVKAAQQIYAAVHRWFFRGCDAAHAAVGNQQEQCHTSLVFVGERHYRCTVAAVLFRGRCTALAIHLKAAGDRWRKCAVGVFAKRNDGICLQFARLGPLVRRLERAVSG